jgi:hypothetical protein
LETTEAERTAIVATWTALVVSDPATAIYDALDAQDLMMDALAKAECPVSTSKVDIVQRQAGARSIAASVTATFHVHEPERG